MKCCDAKQLLELEFEDRLQLENRFPLSEHLEDCSSCRSIEHAQHVLKSAVDFFPDPPIAQLDIERSLRNINAGINANRSRNRPLRRFRWRLVAAVLLACLTGGLAWRTLGSTRMVPNPTRAVSALRPRVAVSTTVENAAPQPTTQLVATDLDRKLLERRREEVATVLLQARDIFDRFGSAPFAHEVDRGLKQLHASGWPISRIVAGFTRVGRDRVSNATAVLAVHYLGQRATPTALSDLSRALDQPELARVAISSLARAGVSGRERLSSVAWDTDLGAAVMQDVLAADGMSPPELVNWIHSAFSHAPSTITAERSHFARGLLVALADCGEKGAQELLSLSRHPFVDELDWLDALAASPHAERVLVRVIEDRSRVIDEGQILRAVEHLSMTSAFDWVVRRIDDRKLRPLALRALASMKGTEPLLTLLDARRGHSEAESAYSIAFRQALERDHERFEQLAGEWVSGELELDGRGLLALLIECELPLGVSALLRLVTCDRLPADERQLAILAVAEEGSARHETELIRALRQLPPEDIHISARLLVVIRRLCGASVVASLFKDSIPSDRERALALIERCASGTAHATALFQLAHYTHLTTRTPSN